MKFPGYSHLKGPETLWLDAETPVSTPTHYRMWQGVLVKLSGASVWLSEGGTEAFVNQGRWLAICRWCKKGMLTRPDWGIACCAQCGAWYPEGLVKFPENVGEITAALLVRPDPDSQNWDNKQTVEDLLRENREDLKL